MHPSLALITLISTMTTTFAAPQTPAQQFSTTTTTGFTTIPGDKMGAIAYLNAQGSTMIVYQAADTSIHSLIGTGPPTSQTKYADGLVLTPNQARNDTPMALAVSNEGTAHIFYLSYNECNGGNLLMEASYTYAATWQNGQLSSNNICVSSDTNLLYALSPYTGLTSGQSGYGVFRVGYVEATTDHLCEAFYRPVGVGGGSASWTTACY
ncbi:hypothetical protein ACLMJK_004668 [Lecanora helva]